MPHIRRVQRAEQWLSQNLKGSLENIISYIKIGSRKKLANDFAGSKRYSVYRVWSLPIKLVQRPRHRRQGTRRGHRKSWDRNMQGCGPAPSLGRESSRE